MTRPGVSSRGLPDSFTRMSLQDHKRRLVEFEIQEYDNLKYKFINYILMKLLPVEDYSEIEWLKREAASLLGLVPNALHCRPDEFIEEKSPPPIVKSEETKTYLHKNVALYELGNYWMKHLEPVEAPSRGGGNSHFLELAGLLKNRIESNKIPKDTQPVTQDEQSANNAITLVGKDEIIQ